MLNNKLNIKTFVFSTLCVFLGLTIFSVSSCSQPDDPKDEVPSEHPNSLFKYFRAGFIQNNSDFDWQDSSYIFAVAKTNTAVLSVVESQLNLPKNERTLIPGGKILQGDGGFNFNASHKFKWHLDPTQVELSETWFEVCDGAAYGDVDNDIDTWLNQVESFCGWTYIVHEELSVEEVENLKKL